MTVIYNTGLMGNKIPNFDGLISQESIRSQVRGPMAEYLEQQSVLSSPEGANYTIRATEGK
jgi:hypothetical protein